MADSDGIRVGDPERQRAVELLGEAMATGYLTVQEFDQRTHAAYSAANRGELQGLVNDLPIRDRLFPSVPDAADRSVEALDLEWTTVRRRGVWAVPARLRITGSMGTAKLDFRSADLPYGGVEIEVQISWSTLKLRLPPTMRVDATGMEYSGWSSLKDKAGPPDGAAGPLVVLRGSAAAGSSIQLRR
ncbi:DUF1707 domain-containing protein [Tsukamurella asaccharolytica]|uniref:DUF1707 domain-containing protein n=1 Tax=Tsukamurella asaccharolytica TaxID=2592067 RepID=A0A5C5R5T3_9ACTN|nr:DUF1707 domain-containing protein [Tsukamurella asaccharolytica]TWS17714.1 DUF1707 domain-containing protein [Tsukamurella asaccharolytica]